MTRLFLIKDDDGGDLWVAAVIDQDVWTYVANTGRFHLNEGAREDFFFHNVLEFQEIGISQARRLIAAGVGTVDEQRTPDSARRWREDEAAMDPDVVFASLAADLA